MPQREKIIQTKQNSTDIDIPVRVNTGEPIWIWDRVRQAVDTPNLVYFPQAYTDRNHKGLTKEEVMQKIFYPVFSSLFKHKLSCCPYGQKPFPFFSEQCKR